MPPPTYISELRSLLGMTNYLSPLLPNYYMCIYPLLELRKEKYSLVMEHKHQAIIDDLKSELISSTVMFYYNLSLNSLIITDVAL